MANGAQFVAGDSTKLGVSSQQVDGELYLVRDTLSVRLVPGPKFQIFNDVVRAVSVFVVNTFVFCQRASEIGRHYIAMLQSLLATALMNFNVSGGVKVPIWINGPPSSALPATFFAAKFLSFIVGTARPTVFVAHKSALFGYATQLALKCRHWFFTHRDWIPVPMGYVKEII